MGTRFIKNRGKKQQKDHPHAYGDKVLLYVVVSVKLGSSPRVWGQGTYHKRQRYKSWDHPHAYGDKAVLEEKKFIEEGSSPRVWGQAKADINNECDIGIIPTRMGTSPTQKPVALLK